MVATTTHQARSGIVVRTTNNQYAFPRLRGDVVRGGDKSDIEGTVTYGGDSLSKHYIRTHDMAEVPDEVISAVKECGVDVLDGVGGGWVRWEGRPELSTAYVDVTDSDPV